MLAELFQNAGHRIETKRIYVAVPEDAPCARRTKKLGCRRFTTGIISQYGDLADKNESQSKSKYLEFSAGTGFALLHFAMNCRTDQIGRTNTLTDSQNLPPRFVFQRLHFFSNQRLLDLSWRSYMVMERSHVNGKDN